MKTEDQLDDVIFTCCQCGNEFDHTQGTWLPIGEEEKQVISVERSIENPPMILTLDFRPPEILTSEHFTCYNCTP